MNAKQALVILSLVITGVTVSGCFFVDNEFRHTRNQLFSGTKYHYEKEVEFALGPFSMWIAKGVASFADDEKEAHSIISEISQVQIGVYKNHHNRDAEPDAEVFQSVCDNMELKGWYRIVKAHNQKENTAVFVKADKHRLRRLFVISQNHEEMVLTDIEGNLNNIIIHAIKERGLRFNKDI